MNTNLYNIQDVLKYNGMQFHLTDVPEILNNPATKAILFLHDMFIEPYMFNPVVINLLVSNTQYDPLVIYHFNTNPPMQSKTVV